MSEAPKRIWLGPNEIMERTTPNGEWAERLFDNEIEYVRADVIHDWFESSFRAARLRIEQLERERDEAREAAEFERWNPANGRPFPWEKQP